MPKSLKYALMVFIGGFSYGAVLPLVRLSYASGFTPGSGMLAHNLLALVILAPVTLVFFRTSLNARQLLGLVAIGVVFFLTSATYFFALTYISPSVAITLMFQYIWMGIIIQAVAERKLPRLLTVASGLVVVAGTVLTTGVFNQAVSLHPLGVALSLLSALCYALFLFFSGRVATDLPAVARSTILTATRLALTLALAPLLITQMPTIPNFFIFGIPLALVGIVIPLVLIQTAAPRLPNSVTTIMSASELPGGILLAAIFVGDSIGLVGWLGIALVLAGIILSQASELRKLWQRLKGPGSEDRGPGTDTT